MGDANTRRNLPELFEHVQDDSPNGLQTLYLCATLENCLKHAHDAELLIFDVLHCFEEEDRKGDRRYPDTLEKLTNFKESGDPFTEFFEIFQIVSKQQKFQFEKLRIMKEKIDIKLKSVCTWAKVLNMILVATFESALIYSAMAAEVVALPVAAALVAAAVLPTESVGKWIDSLWRNYENTVMEQKEVITSMQTRTFLALEGLDTVRILIDRSEVQSKSLLQIADATIEVGAEAVKLGIADIKKKLRYFMEDGTGNASRHVPERIMKPPDS